MKKSLLFYSALLLTGLLSAQVDTDLYRTITGTDNNQGNGRQNWGAANTPVIMHTGNGFADGFGAPAGPDRPNPRTVSNEIFAQEGLLNDPVGLSDFTWVFGQFIDHDITLTEHVGAPLHIPVPRGDAAFDPFNTGQVVIPMTRNRPRFGTGLGPQNPRRYDNEITAYLDGSSVYGSDDSRAAWLRSFTDGKMKVSAGNLPPYNTISGEIDGVVDEDAPHMANGTGFQGRMFVVGDVRGNENPLLLSVHTLFLREHNRQCAILKTAHPDWNDEQLYQHARKLVGGAIQAVVYNEWLPTMGVSVPEYTGYKPNVEAQIHNVFSAAAFRVGHTLLNSNLRRTDNNGNVLPEGNLTLREAFFRPDVVPAVGGIEPYLRGMAEQVQQKMDNRVVDDVRNFLFGPPGAGGLDLAAININRGRDRGLPSWNQIRLSYFLPIHFDFASINPDPEVYNHLGSVYDDIDQIDPWVAMLAERPMEGSIFGQTIQKIMQRQFTDLRNGDRFFYQNDPLLSQEEKDWLAGVTFREIIMHNTDISLMQENVFRSMPFSDICGEGTIAADGVIRVHNSEVALEGVTVTAVNNDGQPGSTTTTSDLGFYDFEMLPACQATSIEARLDDEWSAGVDIFDIIFLRRHVLGIQPFTTPYEHIAGDVNADGEYDIFDIISMTRMILGLEDRFAHPHPQPWIFVPAAYEFSDNYLVDGYPTRINFDEVDPTDIDQGFIAVKLGDLDGSHHGIPERTATRAELVLTVVTPETQASGRNLVTVNLPASAGYQFSLSATAGHITSVRMTDLPESSLRLEENGTLSVAFAEETARPRTLVLELDRAAGVRVDEQRLAAVGQTIAGVPAAVTLLNEVAATAGGLVSPNPFTDRLSVTFPEALPEPATAELLDINGRNLGNWAMNAGAKSFDMTGLSVPAGAYLVRVTGERSGKVLVTERVVK